MTSAINASYSLSNLYTHIGRNAKTMKKKKKKRLDLNMGILEGEVSKSRIKSRTSDLAFSLQNFGPSFVHDASKNPVSPPPYIDPYELLEDERLTRPSSPDVF